MKEKLIILSLLMCASLLTVAQTTVQKPDTKWFEDARFGMFIHYGPYSVLGAGEWVMNSRPIKGSDYMRLQNFFNPQSFDAKEWVKIAKNAGMKYITFTSRHHDGFSNWDTKQSDWNIMNTPYGKDMVKQLADECHKEGIKLVFYYSLLDWMRTDYQYETGRTGQRAGRTEKSDWNSYLNFMKAQLTELLTNYGPIAGIWFDGHWDQTEDENRTDHSTHVDWHYPEIYDLIHRLQPNCLVANNHHLPPFPGEDYQIFERDVPGENSAGYSGQAVSKLPLETCQTINGAWGFNITDDRYKSTKDLLHLLIRTAGTGANLLLNVGPMPDGRIQPECVERLSGIGEWMDTYGYTIYGTQQGFVKPQPWGASTRNDKTYYLHILNKETKTVVLNIPDIQSAKWVNVDSKLRWKKDKETGYVMFILDGPLDDIDSIIEVKVK
ncbi:alpha-L-fucosidase [Parabacteroides sp. PF5-5]|uniref:alpha-L-fucosidase n=1 Tax=unclassified Parabacteroides TaxID=2649774 RepID=UPI0024742898|nr:MULTISPECIES: alpha-L-fucosidase [unclassified Parabacteroides]MDH6304806.1 alpha-L-fucosidase [Parabacteroides sp. PH5-39]MDH6315580.1 alpha-L-fucosidase [Parabacteroides sp. PF5-13]MDH6319240.1 alpha-L-fucosidase [Parabacteroides sp. PH5-13]MDH6322971.1 alpha-L-fucosidase [Parabacteroides sp. PH5-8]MDH6326773.1 alpha-L-fucosidase [Parabacteroides sp. PH5-41]